MLPIQMHIKKSAPTVYIKIHSDISRYLRSKKFLNTFWSSESPTSSLTSFQAIWVSPKPLVSFYTQHFAQPFFFFFLNFHIYIDVTQNSSRKVTMNIDFMSNNRCNKILANFNWLLLLQAKSSSKKQNFVDFHTFPKI